MSDKDIFSEEGELFLKDKMCICLKDLNAKILDDASDEKDFFKCLIDFFLTLEFPYNDISLRDISHNRNFGEDAIFREDDVMYNVLPENKFEKYNDCNLIKLEINDLTNNITYHKKIIKTHEDGYQAIVEITLEHKPIPCMYPHSAFVIVLNDVIVDEKNYDETINQKKGAYKKLFSNIRREIREELTSLMISKKINDTINTEVINEL